MIDEIKIKPFLCRITEECHTMLKEQAKIDMCSMSALAEVIFRDALRKRQPGYMRKLLVIDDQSDQIYDKGIAEKLDKMLGKNDKI
jgi:hypothetical protein|tara:strand:+ start:337 stop:594 length:258 start_codon:yes stop_codon:yes gene_type:complete